ncbi:MAG: DUF2135 domain-containing protein [Deltaproteobacteria bacterium]|nr:DUF2135 domain-containing protein [Deltaproteobacteria bacterium]
MRALAILGICFLSTFALAADKEAPTVEISQPHGGWSTSRIVELKGQISDNSISRVTMVVNGYERTVDVRGGSFKATIVVSKGANSIEVVANNSAGEGRDSVSFFSDVPSVDMQVILSWDTDGTDIDLHVVDPSKEECFYGHRLTKLGGKLDVDDTDGFGPEVFTLASSISGEYQVRVKYYSSHGHPQTKCRVQVVLFEGTNRERRLEFFKILTKTGDIEEIGTWEVEATDEEDELASKKERKKGP